MHAPLPHCSCFPSCSLRVYALVAAMSTPVKISRLQQIVRLRGMLKRWQALARSRRSMSLGRSEEPRKAKPKVVPGHVALDVGEERRRFWVKTAQLSHPVFRALLRKTEEEFGFEQRGALAIPCDPAIFQHLLSLLDHPAPAHDLLLRDLLHSYFHDPPPHVHPTLATTPLLTPAF